MATKPPVIADGAEIPVGTNVWVTDRTFTSPGQPVLHEHVLHLLDYNSSGTYTLTYTENTNVVTDSTTPDSAITSLPAQGPELFPVSWSGRDNAGRPDSQGHRTSVGESWGRSGCSTLRAYR